MFHQYYILNTKRVLDLKHQQVVLNVLNVSKVPQISMRVRDVSPIRLGGQKSGVISWSAALNESL